MADNKKRKKKKQNNPQTAPLSPEKYIVSHARKLPIYRCLLNQNWQTAGEAIAVVMRKHTSGNVTTAIYLVDIFARGVKDTFFFFNRPEEDLLEELENFKVKNFSLAEAPYLLIHNLIYGAVEFAAEHGMQPDKMFEVTMFMLEEDNEQYELMDIAFGVDGEPYFIESHEEAYVNEDSVGEAAHDYKDDPEDEFWNPHWNPFRNFSNVGWQEYFLTHKIISETDHHYVTEIFFEKWLGKHYGMENLIEEYDTWKRDQLVLPEMDDDEEGEADPELEALKSKLFQLAVEGKNSEMLEDLLHDFASKHTDDPELLLYVSDKFALADRYENQLQVLNDVLNRFPDFLPATLSYAGYWLNQNNLSKAVEVLDTCKILIDFNASKSDLNRDEAGDLYSLKGWIALYEKDYLKAWMHFRWIVDQLDLYREVGWVVLEAENFYFNIGEEKAKSYLQEIGYTVPEIKYGA